MYAHIYIYNIYIYIYIYLLRYIYIYILYTDYGRNSLPNCRPKNLEKFIVVLRGAAVTLAATAPFRKVVRGGA